MVSEADQAAEEASVQRSAAAFPSDLILGAESCLTPGDSGWSWTLDPLDGTQNFVAGVPLFAVAIAVLHDQMPVVSLIHDPIRGEAYTAQRGRGARRNGTA